MRAFSSFSLDDILGTGRDPNSATSAYSSFRVNSDGSIADLSDADGSANPGTISDMGDRNSYQQNGGASAPGNPPAPRQKPWISTDDLELGTGRNLPADGIIPTQHLERNGYPYADGSFTPGGPSAHRLQAHNGIDIAGDFGNPVYAASDGIVHIRDSGDHGYGKYIVLEHGDGTYTLYGHLQDALVAAGDQVRAGQVIGRMGNSGNAGANGYGPQLHFEVLNGGIAFDKNGTPSFTVADPNARQNNVNPIDYLRSNK